MIGRLVEAVPEHVAEIEAHVRPEDAAELWAAGRQTPEQAITHCMAASVFTLTGLVDELPVCIFGVVPTSSLSGRGAPWMVGTVHLERHQRLFLRACRGVIDEMNAMFPKLENAVDARNIKAIRWLRWLGFEIKTAVPFGPDRMPFHPFVRNRPNV